MNISLTAMACNLNTLLGYPFGGSHLDLANRMEAAKMKNLSCGLGCGKENILCAFIFRADRVGPHDKNSLSSAGDSRL